MITRIFDKKNFFFVDLYNLKKYTVDFKKNEVIHDQIFYFFTLSIGVDAIS